MKRFGALAATVALIASLLASVGVIEANKLSCRRSNRVRMSQIGYQQYALDAALARQTAANLRLKLINAVPADQHRIQIRLSYNDAWAAAHFRHDVDQSKIHLIVCKGLFPQAS